ncbi:MAG: beta-glucanase (GH16 family) [Mariniflexile sp.]|jgi:beta-glucanase (GH16 family)
MFKKLNFFMLVITSVFCAIILSCSGGGDDAITIVPEPQDIIPTNLALTIEVVGMDANNPYGDGTGVVKCIATATNAVKYGFGFGSNIERESTSGSIEHTFRTSGTNDYLITIFAYSSTGNVISTFKKVTVLVGNPSGATWADEFNIDGVPDITKWSYDIGTGCPNLCGWGNNEAQYYTSRSDNIIVENGLLKINAKKESYQGSQYTSAKIFTKGKFDFKYGTIEIRAKLPSGAGTWPAIWTLGSNINSVGWPACGEIDIMEHAGNRQGTIQSAMHTPSSYGNTMNKGSQFLSTVSTEFHIYKVKWSSEEMVFSVDNVEHYKYNPSTKDSNTWPFDANQYLILNVAMGGSFGGAIGTNFTQSTMEIDYIRVFQ